MKTFAHSIAVAALILCFGSIANAQLPDGAIVFSGKPGSGLGYVAEGMAGRAQGYPARHTHVGIVLGGVIHHADFPRVGTRRIGDYKRGEVVHYVLPARPYTAEQIYAMTAYARSQHGRPYRLRGFFRRDGTEGWCSTFVGAVLNQGGHNISKADRFTPDKLLNAVRNGR